MRATLVALLLAGSVSAEESLDAALLRLRTAPPAQTEKAVAAVVALKPERAAVLTRLKKPFEVESAHQGWKILDATDEKGVKRPFEVYIPKSIAGKTDPVPLLVSMHGGVSRAAFPPSPGQRGMGAAWVASAEEHEFVVACPAGRGDCTWWSDAGVAHVRAVIREVKRIAPIDDDAVVGTGFSDGGSGCFYLAMAAPDPFAAFLPMNGHPAVASGASGKVLYLENMARTPQFCAMTQDDSLYPAVSVLPHLNAAIATGAKLHVVSYPRGGHRPVYFEEQRGAFVRFVADTPRDPHPRAIRWKCASPELGRVAWVELLELGAAEGEAPHPDPVNVLSRPGRVRIGVGVDQTFEGDGVRISSVSKDSLASKIDMKVGDVLVGMDGKGIGGMADLRRLLGGKKYGDGVTFRVRRGDAEIKKEGAFPAFVARPVYRRDKPAASFELQSEGNRIVVRSHNVRRIKLLLPDELFGDGEIALAVNGNRVAPELRVLPLREILTRYAREADSGRVFPREAIVKVP
ncbi:MAG: PDZ domain-containing protein [Planctomycetota bacterium]|jgi:poly(3-hydroxybutyrate) depolymerase